MRGPAGSVCVSIEIEAPENSESLQPDTAHFLEVYGYYPDTEYSSAPGDRSVIVIARDRKTGEILECAFMSHSDDRKTLEITPPVYSSIEMHEMLSVVFLRATIRIALSNLDPGQLLTLRANCDDYQLLRLIRKCGFKEVIEDRNMAPLSSPEQELFMLSDRQAMINAQHLYSFIQEGRLISNQNYVMTVIFSAPFFCYNGVLSISGCWCKDNSDRECGRRSADCPKHSLNLLRRLMIQPVDSESNLDAGRAQPPRDFDPAMSTLKVQREEEA